MFKNCRCAEVSIGKSLSDLVRACKHEKYWFSWKNEKKSKNSETIFIKHIFGKTLVLADMIIILQDKIIPVF